MNDQILLVDSDRELRGSQCQIDQNYVDQIKRWIPEVADFSDRDSEVLLYVPLSIDIGAFCYSVVRTSRRIGVEEQVVSKIYFVARKTLDKFYMNPALYSFYCLSNGLFVSDNPAENPSECFFDPHRWVAEFEKSQLAEIAHSTRIHDRTVVFGGGPKAKFLASLTSLINEDERWAMSFGYGLEVSPSFKLNLSLCSDVDKSSKRFVIDQNIRYFETCGAEFSPSL